MTRPDLAFEFAELSKFVVNPGPGAVYLKAARQVLVYLVGTADKGITYSRPVLEKQVNSLYGWVHSDSLLTPICTGLSLVTWCR
eukprot:2651693-Rhodomonas_salina.3